MEASWISTAVISLASILLWLATQVQAATRKARAELKHLRHTDQLKDRYIYRLERVLAETDQPLPPKPDGWDEALGEEEW